MYDTIVLGDDPSSLIAAVTLASYGRKAILLTMDDTPDLYTESGYTFDIDPLPWTGLNRGGVFRQLLAHLLITQEDHCLDPALQIIFPNHRIDLYNDTQSYLKEMEREFPGNVLEIFKFYKSIAKSSSFASELIDQDLHFQPETVWDYVNLFRNMPGIVLKKRAFTAHLRNIRKEPQLEKVLEAQILLLSNLDPYGISPISFARTLSLSLNTFFYHAGGKHHLIARLKKKFEADGGIIKRCSISTLDMERAIKANVKVAGDDIPTIYGRNIIISTKYEDFASLLAGNNKFSALKKRYDEIIPSLYPFTLHLGVQDRCLPENMGVYVVIVSDETGPDEDGNLLFLETSEPGDTLRAPDGKRAISVTTFLKNSPSELDDNSLQKIAEGMLNNLRVFLPFMDENLDFMDLDKSIIISRSCDRTINHKYRVKDPFIGMSFLPNNTPLKNVFLSGGMLMPGLGFEGEIMSGTNAAKLAIGEN